MHAKVVECLCALRVLCSVICMSSGFSLSIIDIYRRRLHALSTRGPRHIHARTQQQAGMRFSSHKCLILYTHKHTLWRRVSVCALCDQYSTNKYYVSRVRAAHVRD